MSDFTKRVMGAIGNGVDGDDVENPISPFEGTTSAGRHVDADPSKTPKTMPQEDMGEGVGKNGIDEIGEGPEPGIDGPEERQPAPAGVDELGYALVPFTCKKCQTLDHVNPHLFEIYQRRGILCLPCQAPHLWKWKRDDDGNRFLYPDPRGKKPRKRLGEDERRELETRGTELIDRQLRREYLRETILKLQAELSEIEPRIVELTLEVVPTAQAKLVEIETDPQLVVRQKAADVAHEIGLLCASMRNDRKKQASQQHRAKMAR